MHKEHADGDQKRTNEVYSNLQVTGSIFDPSGEMKYQVRGTWDTSIEGSPVTPRGEPTESARLLWACSPLPPNAESVSVRLPF